MCSQAAGEAADTYIVINATCVELPTVRDYVEKMAPQGKISAGQGGKHLITAG
jgi:hypothetical protein